MVGFPVRGGCLCGAVRYAIDAGPESVGVCHCESCRRSAGGDSVAWATVAEGAFRLLSGEPRIHASSPGVRRGFCATCGTTLTYRCEGEQGTIDVTLASLDDPETFPPQSELWLEERLSWNPANPALEPHERGGGAG